MLSLVYSGSTPSYYVFINNVGRGATKIEENLPPSTGASEHHHKKLEVGGSNLMFNCCKELGALL
jgi:hypothetical protein